MIGPPLKPLFPGEIPTAANGMYTRFQTNLRITEYIRIINGVVVTYIEFYQGRIVKYVQFNSLGRYHGLELIYTYSGRYTVSHQSFYINGSKLSQCDIEEDGITDLLTSSNITFLLLKYS